MVMRPAGYLIATDLLTGNETVQETVQCGHCQRHQVIKPFQDPRELGGFCRSCMSIVCDRCVDGPCIPKEQMLEKERRQLEKAIERERFYGHFGSRGL